MSHTSTSGMATPDSEIIANWNDEIGLLRRENKVLNKLLGELKEVESTGHLPDGDHVNFSTKMWLERLIQKTEKESK